MSPDTLGAMEKNSLPDPGAIKQVSTGQARDLRPVGIEKRFIWLLIGSRPPSQLPSLMVSGL